MSTYVVKVKPWEEVKQLAQEFGVSIHGGNLKNRGKWGEYIKVRYHNQDGSYWYGGVRYYPWMMRCILPYEVLENGKILKEDTIPVHKDGINYIIIRIIELCDTIYYHKETVYNTSTPETSRLCSQAEIVTDINKKVNIV